MATTLKYTVGSQAVLLSTELNNLANNSLAVGAAFNNTQGGGGGDGYTLCDVELALASGTTPAASTAMSLWLLTTQDGTNYEDGDAATTPARLPDQTFPLRAVSGAQRVTRRMLLPWGNFKPLLKNDGLGAALPLTGNTLKVRPVTPQGI